MQGIGASEEKIYLTVRLRDEDIVAQGEGKSKRTFGGKADDTIRVCADGAAPVVAAGASRGKEPGERNSHRNAGGSEVTCLREK